MNVPNNETIYSAIKCEARAGGEILCSDIDNDRRHEKNIVSTIKFAIYVSYSIKYGTTS